MLKLHDLQVGQRFTFTDKHRGKVFEVISTDRFSVIYADVATGDDRMALSNRKTFRMPVRLVTTNHAIVLTPHEAELLTQVLHSYYLNEIDEAMKSKINAIHIKLTGSAGRRVVLPEELK